jgi:magnesium transporter
MEQRIINGALEILRARLEVNDLDGAVAVLEKLRPADQADVFEELKPQAQIELLPRLDVTDSADILEELEDEDAADLAEQLHPEILAQILDAMEPDEAADVLAEMEPQPRFEALTRMSDPDEVRPLLLHREETAGGLMTSEFMALRRRMTAAEALAAVHTWAPEAEASHHVFVVDRDGHLMGVVSLLQLIKAEPNTRVEDLMDPDVISVHVTTDGEECARLMARYDILALPVVDDENRLVGALTADDLMEVLEEEATEDIQRLGGAQPLERAYLDTSVFTVARKRIGWLLLLFLTETLTGSVLRLFQQELETAVALAFFIPLLIGTGGNAGSQTTSTIVRALAVGDVKLRDAPRVFAHELLVGLFLGLAMAIIGFGRALTWGTARSVAMAVSAALLVVVLWANVVGSLLPLIASRLRIDPAVVSGPFMSTLVDATGLLIYLSLAKAILGI